MSKQHFTTTITIRSIENGVIIQTTAGPAFGASDRSGEVFFATLYEANAFISDFVPTVEELAKKAK